MLNNLLVRFYFSNFGVFHSALIHICIASRDHMYLSGSVGAGSVVVTSVLASSSVSQFTLDKERDD